MNQSKIIESNKKISQKIEDEFVELLIQNGFNFATGIPCATQKDIIKNILESNAIDHVISTRESEAFGIAAGAYLAGEKPIVYMQNSGLMNSINDINSLLLSYKIPILMIVTWRGNAGEDAPQHIINGKIMMKVLRAINIPVQILTKTNMSKIIKSVTCDMKRRKVPAVILITRRALHE